MSLKTTCDSLGNRNGLADKLGLKHVPYRFQDIGLALGFAQSGKTPLRVVMGDWPELWVVSPADAEHLVNLGYEII